MLNSFINSKKISIVCVIVVFALGIFRVSAQKRTKNVRIINADRIVGGRNLSYKKLIGNVKLAHEGVLMKCDSAYFEERENTLKTFSKVIINQGDSLFTYGDFASYNGNTKLLKLKHNVKLKNDSFTLTTDSLEFNRNKQLAYYLNKGKLVDSTSVLTSQKGLYYIEKRRVEFLQDVLLVSNNTRVNSDTLHYHLVDKRAELFGNSTIKGKKETIRCTRGVYKTEEKIAFLNQRPMIIYDNKTIQSDSIYYDRKIGFASLSKNIEIVDTLNKSILKANYAEIFRKKDSCIVTQKPLYINVLKKDSLFLHSDTITVVAKNQTKILKGYRSVKFFKSNLQGKCDSIHYEEKTNIFKMINDPVIWANKHQLTSDTILFNINKKTEKIDSIKMINNAFMTVRDTLLNFNQIKGRNIYGKFKNGELVQAFVDGNAQLIYYLRDEDKNLIGVNKTACSYMRAIFENKKIKWLFYLDKPTSRVYQFSKLKEEDRKLRGFAWHEDDMILKKEDVFRKGKRWYLDVPPEKLKTYPFMKPSPHLIYLMLFY